MKLFLRILNFFTVLLALIYIFLTRYVYFLLVLITGNWTSSIYNYSKIPYHLLWLTLAINIILTIVNIIKNKKFQLLTKTGLIIVFLLLATIIFTPRFEFLEYYNDKNDTYPNSVRYDKLFVYNKFYSNEGDYEGGYGDTKYLYIPIAKKIIYFDSKGIKSYNVKYLKDDKVLIGNIECNITERWFSES